MSNLRSWGAWLILTLAILLYGVCISILQTIPRQKEKDLLSVAIPAPFQVLLSGGDSYLASNTAVFRALVVGTGKLDRETYAILGRVQSDAAQLNPAHEDNYYVSQAILPWNGELDAELFIQERAMKARTWDALPPFFLAFDKFYFQREPVQGAKLLQIAAERSSPNNRKALMAMAARWSERGDDPRIAVTMIDVLARNTRDKELKSNLEARRVRMEGLAELRDAEKAFREKNARSLTKIEELVTEGFLTKLPTDPLGQGYTVDSNGIPIVSSPKSPGK